MTLDATINELKKYRDWKLGFKLLQPDKITEAIEVAIHLLDELNKKATSATFE